MGGSAVLFPCWYHRKVPRVQRVIRWLALTHTRTHGVTTSSGNSSNGTGQHSSAATSLNVTSSAVYVRSSRTRNVLPCGGQPVPPTTTTATTRAKLSCGVWDSRELYHKPLLQSRLALCASVRLAELPCARRLCSVSHSARCCRGRCCENVWALACHSRLGQTASLHVTPVVL